MKIDIEVISRDMIKPSTPTPHHFRNYQFSFLDQIAPPDAFLLIFFFNLDCKLSNNDISNHLKTSLSKVLTHYYPLAGRVNDNYVDCNDEGVLFLEVQVSGQLSQILQEPFLEVNRFAPVPDGVSNLALAIQVNFFKCGNVAVCARMSHRIADGLSFLTFIKNWAATARHPETNVICPEFVAAKVFPPKDDGGFDLLMGGTEKNIVLKRFEFRNSVIAALKERYARKTTAENHPIRPTRVEALTTLIWSRFSASTQTKIGPDKPLLLCYAINLRKRMNPPLPDNSFGNLSPEVGTISLQDTREEDCYSLVNKLRESVSRIDKDYVKKLQDGTYILGDLKKRMAQGVNKGEMVEFYFSSLCWYPVYETDFGWGRPVSVALGGLAYKNLVLFMDTKSGDGIEAWIHLKEEDMAKFVTDRELLAYVSAISSM